MKPLHPRRAQGTAAIHATRCLSKMLATAGGVGYSPIAPGSLGALLALPAGGLIANLSWGMKLGAVLLLSCGAMAVIQPYLASTGTRDPQEVVLDEVVGCLTALAFVPWEIPWVVAAFLLFRLFDVSKPWPIRAIERVRGAVGVVGDDVAAGLFAGALLYAAHLLALNAHNLLQVMKGLN
jgi:phosphatidylglycerophosphatase A